MQLFHIRHRTHYIYSGLIIDSANQIKLYPINDEIQRVNDHRIHISGSPSISVFKDYFGNTTGFFTSVTSAFGIDYRYYHGCRNAGT